MMPEYSNRYMIYDSQNELLACAVLKTPPDSVVWRFQVLGSDLNKVLEHEIVNLIATDSDGPDMTGRILSSDHVSSVEVEPVDLLGESLRQNLRVPVRFDSFIYPVSGSWTGRVPIICHDLSCGGMAFFCNFQLRIAEIVEVVIPITSQPVILRAMILRLRPSNSNIPLYSAKFVDMIHDEEVIVREAVFSQQLTNHGRQR